MGTHDWERSSADCRPEGLYIGGVLSVSSWEKPLQEAMARSATQKGGVVLEVGYGLGLASRQIQALLPTTHVIIEAHEEVATRAVRTSDERAPIVICSTWERSVHLLREAAFSGILFDAAPPTAFSGTAEEMLELVAPFLEAAARLLAPGGSVVFADFSREIERLPKLQHAARRIGNLRTGCVPLNIPKGCSYASGTSGNYVAISARS